MKLMVLVVFVLALAACGGGSTVATNSESQPLSANHAFATSTKTYTIPAGACQITYCSRAPLLYGGHQVATIGYTDGVTYFTNTHFIGTVTFNTTRFTDFQGYFTNGGTVIISGLSYTVWNLVGTFSNGMDTLSEHFDVRGHSGRGGGNTIINSGGTVTTPLVTPAPTAPPPSPTPVPSPTDN
jgi:hypothetical protein